MTMLGLSSKREVIRTSIRVRTAMAAQVREQVIDLRMVKVSIGG